MRLFNLNTPLKGYEMKIKVFTPNGQKIVNVVAIDDVTAIAVKYNRWEYI